MKDLSLYALELAENSLEAEADLVEISLKELDAAFILEVSDNGSGISDDMLDKAALAGYSTKGCGRGFGLSELKTAAEKTGGSFKLASENSRGTRATAKFIKNEFCPPVGDIASTVRLLAVSRPGSDFLLRLSSLRGESLFDTREVKNTIGSLSITYPEISIWIKQYLEEQTKLIFGGAADEITC